MWSNQTDMNRTGDVDLTPPETEVKGYPPAVFISDQPFNMSKSQKDDLVELPFN